MVRGSEGGNFSSSSYEELLTESNFSCHWQNCNTIEDSVDALFIHILQVTHALMMEEFLQNE